MMPTTTDLSRAREALKQQISTRLSNLNDKIFENLIFDILIEEGLVNVSWRTPGADGGRDIEGTYYLHDFSGFQNIEKWFIECKRHATSLDWPTVFNKVAYAVSNNAEYLLIATTSSLSPACLTEVEKWNASLKRPRIRYWIHSDLVNLVINHKNILAKYFFDIISLSLAEPFINLSLHLTRLVQNIYISYEFESLTIKSIEAASALSELLNQRTNDLRELGKPKIRECLSEELFQWIEISENTPLKELDQHTLVCFLSCIRYITKSEKIKISYNGTNFVLEIDDEYYKNTDKIAIESNQLLNDICFWGNFYYKPNGKRVELHQK